MPVRVTERGWPGHFCAANRCRFRRNTLIEGDTDTVVVSTVGAMDPLGRYGPAEEIGYGRHFETMVFGVCESTAPYFDADVTDERVYDGRWFINWSDYDDEHIVELEANRMHNEAVHHFINSLSREEVCH